jgi:hypothetical protein
MADAKTEKRRHNRYKIEGCEVQSLEPALLGFFTKKSQKQMVLNISRDGINFLSSKPFARWQNVILNITAPSLNDNPINLKIRVTWSRKMHGSDNFVVGGRFSALDQENLNRLKVLLAGTAQAKSGISSTIKLDTTKK